MLAHDVSHDFFCLYWAYSFSHLVVFVLLLGRLFYTQKVESQLLQALPNGLALIELKRMNDRIRY